MALIKNKPYVWLDKSGTAPVIKFKVWCWDDFGVNEEEGFVEEREDADILYVIYKITAGIETPDILQHNLDSSSGSIYSATRHNKVTLIILKPDDSIAGFTSIMPTRGNFELTPAGPPDFYPFCWLQFVATDDLIVHVAAEIPSSSSMSELEPDPDPVALTWTTGFRIADPKSADVSVFHREIYLNESNNFDPVYDTIYVNLIEFDVATGLEKRKGGGTVITSEADASGND